RGIIAGKAVLITSVPNSNVMLGGMNDTGEVVWVQSGGPEGGRIYSSRRGLLRSFPGICYQPSINNPGDVIWQESPGNGTWQFLKLAAGSTTPVMVTTAVPQDAYAINDLGEVVWTQDVDGYQQIISSVRGQLTFGDHGYLSSLKLDDCGRVGFKEIKVGIWTENLYLLEGNGTCQASAGGATREEATLLDRQVGTGRLDSAASHEGWYRFEAQANQGVRVRANWDQRPPNLLTLELY